jgi:chitin disaccharide deacetylase
VTAQQISEHGNGDEHERQSDVVAPSHPAEQDGVGGFIDRKAARGDDEETARGQAQRGAMTAKSQQVVPNERDREGDQPAQHIGQQRTPSVLADQPHHHSPMHRRSERTDGDEARDAPARGRAAHLADEHSRGREICICVDDFGLHDGVNEAALALAGLARVHAIGCLVGGRAWNSIWSARLQRQHAAGIDIGLHLDLTESPLLPRSRRRLPSLIAGSLLHRLDAGHIRAEIQAQLDQFEQALGHGPAFVDGHQHVHQLPVVRRELLDELASRYQRQRPWLRSTRAGAGAGSLIKARGIELLGARGLDAQARRMGFCQNARLLGVYDFEGGADRYRELVAGWLASARNADLLMCHAGVGPQADDPICNARQWEYQVLASTAFGELLDNAALTLGPMSRILARSRRPA